MEFLVALHFSHQVSRYLESYSSSPNQCESGVMSCLTSVLLLCVPMSTDTTITV